MAKKHTFMKHTIFVITVLVSFITNAQFGGVYWNDKIKARFLNSKTLVVKTGNEHFDTNIENGFKKYWTHTPFEMVEANHKINDSDESISYVIPYKFKIADGYTVQYYPHYGVIIGGSEDEMKRVVADIILDGFGYESKIEEAAYRAYGMVKIMQDYIQLKLDGKPVVASSITKVAYNTAKIYNAKAPKIKKKTLLVDKDQLTQGPYATGLSAVGNKSMSQVDFKSVYGGKVKFVSKEELEEAINSNNTEYCYFLPIYSRSKYIFVVDCESGSIWYNGYSTTGMFFSKGDIKALVKAKG